MTIRNTSKQDHNFLKTNMIDTVHYVTLGVQERERTFYDTLTLWYTAVHDPRTIHYACFCTGGVVHGEVLISVATVSIFCD